MKATLAVFENLEARQRYEAGVFTPVVEGIKPIVVCGTTYPLDFKDNRLEHISRMLANAGMWAERGDFELARHFLRAIACAATVTADQMENTEG
ncbi:MAG: hypothetical protein SFY81_04845 [Verrucomicrobiota bacterium]|nr:hypothetical protein [Verrucomicrobiota bacterium]